MKNPRRMAGIFLNFFPVANYNRVFGITAADFMTCSQTINRNIDTNFGDVGGNFLFEIKVDFFQFMFAAIFKANTFRCPHRIDRIVYMLVHVNIIKATFHNVCFVCFKIWEFFKRTTICTMRYNHIRRQMICQRQRSTAFHIN